MPNDSVLANKSTLTVSAYVEKEDKREKIDIVAICKRLKQEVVPQGAELRKQVDEIMATLQ